MLATAAGVAVLLFLLSAFSQGSPQKFYYAYQEKIPLQVLDNQLIVKFSPSKSAGAARKAVESAAAGAGVEWQDNHTAILTLPAASAKESVAQKLKSDRELSSLNPMYALTGGSAMGVTDEFLVKFTPQATTQGIAELMKKHGVSRIKSTAVFQLLRVPKGSDALEIANRFQESGLVVFSQPNFITRIELHQAPVTPTDPFFNRQFYLNNTGQVFNPIENHAGTNDADIDATEAWAITRGNNNILIAVLDEGVTAEHPDLPNSRQVRLTGSNYGDGDLNNPGPVNNNNHGNSCAGIIAATHNNEGIAGIAPTCRIMPVRIFTGACGGITIDRLADAIDFARRNGADVISNSWGFTGLGADNPNLHPAIVEAIRTATTQGRNGRGCVVAFAAGNTANLVAANNGYVAFPANVNIAGVLTVGASDRNDRQANYSPTSNPNSGNNQIVDLTAPSHRAYPNQITGETGEIWTIDIPNNAGYNPYPADNGNCQFTRNPPVTGEQLPNAGINFLAYTGRFGGTSAACPQVAGVAALMLSVNPNLTQQQVFNIITANANRVGGYTYTNGRSNELGAGRLNACNAVSGAVRAALILEGPLTVCTSASTFTLQNVPATAPVTWTASGNLTPASGSGTTATVSAVSGASGSGSVTFTVNACTPFTVSRNVQVGIIPSDQVKIYPRGGSTPITSTIWAAPGTMVNFDGSYFADVSYQWKIVYPSPGYVIGGNSRNLNFQMFDTPNKVVTIVLTVTNACGTSGGYSVNITNRISSYSVYPNPAVDEVTIETVENGPAPEAVNASGSRDSNQGAPKQFDVTLYDKYAKVRRTGKTQNGTLTLPLADLPEGLYQIRISHQQGAETKSLFIKH